MYLKFLRHLYTVTDLFKESVLFILKEHYKSDFERLYKMGLHGKAQKWTIKSINEINEEVVLGFTEK